jgi:ABC-type sugar transport system substrate-binding protein
MSHKLASMLIAGAAVALLAAPAAARTAHAAGHHPKAKIARTYLQHRVVAGAQFYTPEHRWVPAVNAFRHYDGIFVLDP